MLDYKNIKHITFISVIIFQILLICFFALPLNIKAQESYRLSVSPPTFEIRANPGDILENAVKAENLTNNPLVVTVNKRNFVAAGEEGAVQLVEENDSHSVVNWIEVIPSSFTIPPKSSYSFIFKTKVPINAEPGGHFASIVFKSGGGTTLNQTGATIVQEMGVLILVKIAGKTNESAVIESFKATKNFWEYGSVELETRVKNIGNIHIKPVGKITIKNIFNKTVASLDVDSKNILPGAIRKGNIVWNQKWLFGMYTATLNLSYGDQKKIITETTTFIGLPYKIVVGVVLVLIILIVFIYRGRRRLKKAFKVLFSKD